MIKKIDVYVKELLESITFKLKSSNNKKINKEIPIYFIEQYHPIHNNIRNLILSYFRKKRKIYVSKIQIIEKDKVYIQFTYYSKKRFINYYLYKKEIIILCIIIEKLYNKNVIITINRVRYPFLNAQIFANNLSKNLFNFRRIRKQTRRSRKLLNKAYRSQNGIEQENNIILPIEIKGIKIQLHGRLLKEGFKPRKTQKTFIYGSLSNTDYLDEGFYTSSNRRGSFTIKVFINNKFNLFIF